MKFPNAPTTRALGRSQGRHARSSHHSIKDLVISALALYGYKVRPAQFTLSGEESCVNFTIDSMNFWSLK
jgi:hypothetical protein